MLCAKENSPVIAFSFESGNLSVFDIIFLLLGGKNVNVNVVTWYEKVGRIDEDGKYDCLMKFLDKCKKNRDREEKKERN